MLYTTLNWEVKTSREPIKILFPLDLIAKMLSNGRNGKYGICNFTIEKGKLENFRFILYDDNNYSNVLNEIKLKR